MGKIVSKLKRMITFSPYQNGAKISLLFLVAAFFLLSIPVHFLQAQFGMGAFWKMAAAASGPPNPSGLGATPAEFSVQLAWTSGGGSTSTFRVAWAAGATAPADCNTATTSDIVTGISASPYTVSGLLAGTQYSFRVCAADASNVLSSGVTVTSTTTSSSRYIFTSTGSYTGSNAPTCASLATTASLPNAANYKMARGVTGTTLMANLGGVKLPLKNRNPGGYQIAVQSRILGQLTASALFSQVDVAVTGNSWTGATTTGAVSATHCVNWSNATGGQTGGIGLSDATSATWFSTGTASCNAGSTHIVCIDTTNGTIPPVDPMSLAFTATSSTEGTLTWTNPDPEIISSNYVVFLDPTTPPATGCATAGSAQNGSSTGTSVSLTGLTAGATYYIRLCSVDEDALVSNGKTVTVSMAPSTVLWLTGLTTSGISSTGFTANVAFTGDSDSDYSSATLYYCNATLNAGCNPQNTGTGYASATMTKSGSNFTVTVSGLAPTTWNLNDVLNIRAVIADPDGTNGSPLNGTLTLLDVIQPPASWGSTKMRIKGADLSGSYNAATTINADGDLFGYRLAAYGRIAVVTAQVDDNGTTTINAGNNTQVDSGAVFIIRDTSASGDWSTYVIDKYLKTGTPATHELFGGALAFDGTTLAIGAPHETGQDSAGKVYIYREAAANGNWTDVTLKATITEPTWATTQFDKFGSSLAISGRNLFVGHPNEDGANETAGVEAATLVADSGAVDIYYDATGDGTGYPASTPDKKIKQRNDANALVVTQKALFGTSISYSGSSLLVGAPGAAGFGVPGKAIVYSCKVTATGNPCGPTINWAAGTNTITAKVLTTTSPMNVPDTTLAENFYGFSVSMDDDEAVVGAYADNTPNESDNTGTTVSGAGAAYVWHSTNGNADWSTITMVKKLKKRDNTGAIANVASANFGYGVAILGPVVAVGASRMANTIQPQVNVFKDSDGDANFSTGTVTHHERILAPYNWASGQTDKFGDIIVLDNSTGVFHLFVAAYSESSADTVLATDANPGSGSAGYQSGSVFVYGP